MVFQVDLPVFFACITLFHYTVLAQPTGSVTVASDLGNAAVDVAGQAGTSGGLSADTAADIAAAASSAAQQFGEAAGEIGTNANALLNGGLAGSGGITSAVGSGVSGAANAAMELEAAKLAAAMELAANSARLGGMWANDAMNIGRNTLGGNFAVIPGMVMDGARQGASAFVDWGDSTSRNIQNALRTGTLGGAQALDGGLAAMGLQQPVFTPMVNSAWGAVENGRANMFNQARQGFGNPSGFFNLGGLGGSGAAGTLGGSGAGSLGGAINGGGSLPGGAVGVAA